MSSLKLRYENLMFRAVKFYDREFRSTLPIVSKWTAENLVPVWLDSHLTKIRELGEGKKDSVLVRKEARERLYNSLGRGFVALGMYRFVAHTYGVGAWDFGLKFKPEEVWMKDASPLAITGVTAICAALSPSARSTLSHVVMPLEATLSLIRTVVEQKIWKIYKQTPNPQGTFLYTPYLDAVSEFGYKAATGYYTTADDELRLKLGLVGVWGNLARLATDGLLYLALRYFHSSVDPKSPQF